MTNTTLGALKQVREAKTIVLSKLSDTTLPRDAKHILGEVLINLQEQENTLINFTLQEMVDKVNATNDELKDLIGQMNDTSLHLSAIANTIKKISGVLGTLTEITTKALDAGLLG
ncbi:MAG: hypothetical protein ABI416_11645 [Ginsengibacter sp.]